MNINNNTEEEKVTAFNNTTNTKAASSMCVYVMYLNKALTRKYNNILTKKMVDGYTLRGRKEIKSERRERLQTTNIASSTEVH